MRSTPVSASKVARSRERMRAAGLRPVQFWVPDTRSPSFVADVRAQCMALRDDSQEHEAMHFAQDAAGHVEGWT